MLHSNYIETTFKIYDRLGGYHSYIKVVNAVERLDNLFSSSKDKIMSLYNFKYSNPTKDNLIKFINENKIGVYYTSIFIAYLDYI